MEGVVEREEFVGAHTDEVDGEGERERDEGEAEDVVHQILVA